VNKLVPGVTFWYCRNLQIPIICFWVLAPLAASPQSSLPSWFVPLCKFCNMFELMRRSDRETRLQDTLCLAHPSLCWYIMFRDGGKLECWFALKNVQQIGG